MVNWKDKETIVKDFKKSGATIENFAPTRNISGSSLRKWIKAYDLNGPDGLKANKEK
ncbi:hypothetical protein [Spiroplasma endosymbiont of Othius punctulatus]|uniref:hypothetical protein n=1 Tax=Spiroplasma endosymbiont of Othius punctulatus TaxID=3066289 RepID=UPI0030D62313